MLTILFQQGSFDTLAVIHLACVLHEESLRAFARRLGDRVATGDSS